MGSVEYKGLVDAFTKIYAREGVRASGWGYGEYMNTARQNTTPL